MSSSNNTPQFYLKHSALITLYTNHIWNGFDGSHDDEEKAINPDLLIRRQDGFYDIYDLKTAVLDRTRITKGAKRRRRFIDYVEEGIAQLAHYRSYFTSERNAAHAFAKYGVRVSKPNLILVVGNYDNAKPRELEEASRKLGGISIIDYDSLLQSVQITSRDFRTTFLDRALLIRAVP